MYHVKASVSTVHILKPPFGSDLLPELEAFVRTHGINLAWLSGLGAVSRATIRYYDQPNKTWTDHDLDQRLEVTGLWGNVSLLNGEPSVHAHCVLADEQGRCYGGHLGANTLVFNLEIQMTVLTGPSVLRKMDPQTGLSIWH
jgi:predicted DNA-binding protein with PD1-like motif